MMRSIFRVSVVLLLMLCSSCAYIQTHKNVEEMGSYYTGHLLAREQIELVKSRGQWYIGAEAARFRLKYPMLHDSVFRKLGNYPSFEKISWKGQTEYHPISSYVAGVLQNPTGYFDMQGLAQEIAKTPGTWGKSLPDKQRYSIQAELPSKPFQMEEHRVPEKKKPLALLLGKLDFIVIDIPGTLLYNTAIPLMAPFVFFYEFYHEN